MAFFHVYPFNIALAENRFFYIKCYDEYFFTYYSVISKSEV